MSLVNTEALDPDRDPVAAAEIRYADEATGIEMAPASEAPPIQKAPKPAEPGAGAICILLVMIDSS